MSEVVLVVLQRLDTAAHLLRAALRLAELAMLANGARINVLAVAEPASLAVQAAYEEWLADRRAAMFDPRWHAVPQDIAGTVEERGGRADLVVIARPVENDDRSARQAFRAALLKTDRPVLVVPPGGATENFGSCCDRVAGGPPYRQSRATRTPLHCDFGSCVPAGGVTQGDANPWHPGGPGGTPCVC